MKKCKKCGEHKELSKFHYAGIKEKRKGREWRAGICKKCAGIKSKVSMKKGYSKYKRVHKEYMKKWGKKNKAYIKERNAYWKNLYRDAALKKYGGKCNCCGEKEKKFLCIDHINNDGVEHRKKIGSNIYSWLRKNNYPKGFQVLCYNCNNAKARYGKCPHQK